MSTNSQIVEGLFQHVVYSPKGGIEGVLISLDDKPVQIVFERHDETTPEHFLQLKAGQSLAIEAVLQGESPKGPGEHPVYAFIRLKSVDGKKPAKTCCCRRW